MAENRLQPQQSPLVWLRDPNDPRVRSALLRACPICHVPKGRVCVYPFGAGEPLQDRVIHMGRLRPDLQPKRSAYAR